MLKLYWFDIQYIVYIVCVWRYVHFVFQHYCSGLEPMNMPMGIRVPYEIDVQDKLFSISETIFQVEQV